MKKVLIALLALIVVAVIAATLLLGKLDGYIAEAIEEQGSATLGSKVSVTSVTTDLSEGSAIIKGFSIDNPQGYVQKKALEIDSFTASVDYANQVIKEIIISKPTINAEQVAKKNNFQDLLANMPDTDDEADSSGDDTILVINRLLMQEAKVNLAFREVSVAGKSLDIADQQFIMDDFEMTGLSGTAEQLSDQITQALTKHISAQISTAATRQIRELAKDKAKEKVTEKINEALEGELGDKLKGLFGKDKKN